MPSVLPIWNYSAREPAGNLAADEAMLDWCEAGEDRQALRFWESPVHFVVLGYGNRAAEEVRLEGCRAAGVPVLRRCSGGGTVLQGPGCLNYSVVLEIARMPGLASITGTNQFVMERNRAAIEQRLGRPVSIEGFTDLATGGRKFSGNAQRRRRRCLLFHGTILVGFDLARVAQLLLLPPRQPAYRRARAHGDFITNLPIPAAEMRSALARAWNGRGAFDEDLSGTTARLVAERYGRDDWNLRI
jgi:lipoate-protein ligase A